MPCLDLASSASSTKSSRVFSAPSLIAAGESLAEATTGGGASDGGAEPRRPSAHVQIRHRDGGRPRTGDAFPPFVLLPILTTSVVPTKYSWQCCLYALPSLPEFEAGRRVIAFCSEAAMHARPF